MTTEEYLASGRGMKRIREIAKQMNRSHGICMRQCLEMAKKDVAEWYQNFNFGMKKGEK